MERSAAEMMPPAACGLRDVWLAHVFSDETGRRTLSAMETVSLRCFKRLATSEIISRRAGGGNEDGIAVLS